ncbi:hypothetical protein [Pseudomonas graminis]|uniref:Uncharacterized protein n=1 Tax=Pseudomonas graminis TaxID=158627 RepID=A0A1C2DMC5_9PSED|nr:hypothetical protein [Pseudomonas graminis]OCX15914.1 hypothetical protein BBI10_19535 [Pseudomonas graminis]RZI54203.1 MAG: hypothetical protein EOP12_04160 [Pseudomonas sp.]
MTDTNNDKKQYIELTAGPLSINEGLFYVYPGDWYSWIDPEGGGGGEQVVLYRVFTYIPSTGEVAVAYNATTPGGQKKTTEKPEVDRITDGFYFQVQAEDYIHIDFTTKYKVYNKTVIFDERTDTAVVRLLVETVEDPAKS